MFKKIKKLLIVVVIITISLVGLYCHNGFQKKQLKEISYVSMLAGIEKNSERLEEGNYYARIYHESNLPDIQEYNVICIHNDKQGFQVG